MKAKTVNKGFSLLEMVLVLSILTVVAALASPRYARSAARYRADSAARRVVRDLALARQRARSQGTSQTVQFNVAQSSYVLPGSGGSTRPFQTYSVDLTDRLYQASIASANFGGGSIVTFNAYGVPDSGGTVVLRTSDMVRTVVVDAQSGKADVQ